MWILVVWAFVGGTPAVDTVAFRNQADCEAARRSIVRRLEADPKLAKPGGFCVNTATKYI